MIASPFQKAYEFESKYGVLRLKTTIQKAEEAYKTYQPETIGFCKNILESICKQIIEEKGESYTDKENTQNLVGKAIKLLDLNQQLTAGICNIVYGCSQIAKGVGEIRNDLCITGHGATDKKVLPTKTDIDICVVTTMHIVQLIMAVLSREKINLSTTQLKYSTVDDFSEYHLANNILDHKVKIDWEPQNGILFINGKELRPSEILYLLDRPSYKSEVEEFIQEILDTNSLEEILLESYKEDYVIEENVDIESISFFINKIWIEDSNIIIIGKINWDEIKSKDAESMLKENVSADFKTSFTCEFDDTNNLVYNFEPIELI